MLSSNEILFIKKRLVEKFEPLRIILFGSQARNKTDKHSDVDLLIITRYTKDRRKLMVDMERELKGLDYARDIIILSPEEFERDKKIAGTVARYAFLEGKVLYG